MNCASFILICVVANEQSLFHFRNVACDLPIDAHIFIYMWESDSDLQGMNHRIGMQHIDLCSYHGIKGQLMDSFHSRFRILSIHQYALFIVDRYFKYKQSRFRRKNAIVFFFFFISNCVRLSLLSDQDGIALLFQLRCVQPLFFYRYWHEERLSKMWIEQSTYITNGGLTSHSTRTLNRSYYRLTLRKEKKVLVGFVEKEFWIWGECLLNIVINHTL